MQVYGTHEGLLAETGTPPLLYTQEVQLAQFRYRLRACLLCSSPSIRLVYHTEKDDTRKPKRRVDTERACASRQTRPFIGINVHVNPLHKPVPL